MNREFKELNKLFKSFDMDSVLLSYRIGRWVAWPVVKETLWLTLRSSGSGCIAKKISFRKINLFLKSFKSIGTILFGIKKTNFILAYSPNSKYVCGQVFHPNFGFECAEGMLSDALKLIYQRLDDVEYQSQHGAHLYIRPLNLLLAPIVRLLSFSFSLRKLARALVCRMIEIDSDIEIEALYKPCLNQLALFIIKEKIYYYIFSKTKARYLLLQDPDGKVSEVAAAKKLGMQVIEMQHGVFGANDIDYSWQENHVPFKKYMPTADKVLVYGILWKSILCSNKYWSSKDIVVVGYPLIDHYVRDLEAKGKASDKLNTIIILFASQPYVHADANVFWSSFFLKCIQDNFKVKVCIKLHPNEHAYSSAYGELKRRFPEHCTILPHYYDVYMNAEKFDIVVGYSSMMLIDFVGLGKCAYSIVNKISGDDLCSMFMLTELSGIIKSVSDPQELINAINEFKSKNIADISISNSVVFMKSEEAFGLRLKAAII